MKMIKVRGWLAVALMACAFMRADAETNFYEYAEARGWAGLGTDYYPNAKSVFTFKVLYVNSGGDMRLFRAVRANERPSTVLILNSDLKTFDFSCYTRGDQPATLEVGDSVIGQVITGVLSNTTRTCVINGHAAEMSPDVPVGTTGWDPTLSLQGGNCTMRLYYFTISENGKVVRDYRPCKADGVSGYYDIVTGKFLGYSGSYGSLTAGGNRLYRLTAAVVPADAGSIDGPRDQFVSAEEAPAVLTAVPANEKCVFEGWRYAGTTEIFSTEPVLQLGAPTADAVVEAVFSMKKIAYSFDLGDAGLFTENGQSTITVEYDYGATPALPAYTLNEGCYFQRWNRAVPATIGAEDLPFVAVAVTPETKVIRVDPAAPSTGEGKTWATALNSFEDAADLAKHCSAEVWLAGDTNKLAAVVSLWSGAVIRGGFAAADGPTDAEQLAARDAVTHPTVLEAASGNTTGLFNQTATLEGASTLDGLTLVNSINSEGKVFSCATTGAKVDFTNCNFMARGTVPATIVNCKSCASGAFRFFDCRVTDLNSTAISQDGLLAFHSGTLVFDRCRFEGNSNKGRGVVSGGSSAATFTDCVFQDNSISSPYQGKGAACVTGSNSRFSRCRFIRNKATNAQQGIVQFFVMQDCQVLSNTVSRISGTDELILLAMGPVSSSRLLRTTIAENVIERNQTDLAAGTTVWSYIISPASELNADAYRAYVNLTVAKNRVEATLAEGVTHEVATLVWGGASNRGVFGGAVNCTFYDNDVTAEIVDRASSKSIDIYLFNCICWNDRADYRPLWSHTPGTTRGFRLYDCILKNYSADTEKVYAAEGVSAEDPMLKQTPKIEPDGQWTFPMARRSKAFHYGTRVQENANLVFKVPTVVVEGANWFATYNGWNTGTQQKAPYDVYVDITDICGRERPADRVVIGSTQTFRPKGLHILVQ